MIELKTLLNELTELSSIGHLSSARKIIGRYLDFCQLENCGANGIIATMNKGKGKTILFDAHIDEVGMVVTDISDSGFVTVNSAGGIDLRHLPSKEVIIHGKKDVLGIFASTPPHLAKDDDKCPDSIDTIKIDTGLGERAKEVISKGDFVTYKNTFLTLLDNKVCAKALDNRAGCAVLILLANLLKEKETDNNIVFLFSDSEELGLRGARTAAFKTETDSAIVIDVSFGNAPGIDSTKCAKLGGGVMIGVSPILDRNITKTLTDIAKENNIPFKEEVMGGSTGTNADVISVSKSGVKTGLVSIPLRNMHTDCEIVDLRDIENTAKLLYNFVLAGGNENA